MDALADMSGTPVLICSADGDPVGSDQDAVQLIADSGGAEWIAVPVERFDPEFFRLSSGIAGAVLQKFIQYRTRLAVIGDVTPYTTDSEPFAALVHEANRGRHHCFVPDLETFTARVSG